MVSPSHSSRRSSEPIFPVVGIGASAGGLEAFTELIQNLPADTGMGFVLVQHLRPDMKSMLAEILGRKSQMPVIEAVDGLEIQPNNIYVMPGAADLEILDGKLSLLPRSGGNIRHLPIDHFLKSLAADRRSRAIGVILSGAGADGTSGLTAIKAEGGVTFAQDQSSAAQGDMPRHAVESDVVDYVLAPAAIARELARMAKHPYLVEEAEILPPTKEEPEENLFRHVFLLLRRKTGMDFSGYKRSTFARRLARRMVVTKISTLEEYVQYLRNSPEELEALYQDVLIMVTEFFRDPETFQYLKSDIFPRIVAQKELEAPLRLWVVGCSSGQEAYSFAIALLEFLGETPSYSIQIFGSDVNEKDIEKARAGFYPSTITSEVSPDQLRRFFVESDGGYRVHQRVRQMCTFAKHDLTRDPPFSKVDLISCRNVLIYFDRVLQERVVPVFHYALARDGFLLLGRSESIGRGNRLFDAFDAKHRVYVKKPVSSQLPVEMLGLPGFRPHGIEGAVGVKEPREKPLDSHDIQLEADRALARAYAPTSVIVDAKYEALQFRGRTGAFFEHPPGKASLDVFQMAREGLAYDLRRAVEDARMSMAPTQRNNVRMKTDGAQTSVDIEVTPFKSSDGQVFFAISFWEPLDKQGKSRTRARTESALPAVEVPGEAEMLRKELLASREHLQAMVEERDVGAEELRAALEEVQSSNEELQSTNEELETAKEELQSINEELTTVNDELQTRNLELTHVNDDVSNLLQGAVIPIVMLDESLRIRRFTPGTEAMFRVVPSDAGRPISDIKPKISVPDLEEFLRTAISRLMPETREVQDEQGRWYSMTARPYKTATNRVGGVVLSFVDVDQLKRSEENLRQANTYGDALREADMAFASDFDFHEVMRQVMVVATKALRAESAAVVTASSLGWIVRAVHGPLEELAGTFMSDSELPEIALARATRSPVMIEKVEKDGRVSNSVVRRFGVSSELVVPLIARGEAVGALLIGHLSRTGPFGQSQVDFATNLAASISLALENALLLKARRRLQELSTALADILGVLAASQRLDDSLAVVLDKARVVLRADRALASFRSGDTWTINSVLNFPPEVVGQAWGQKEAGAFPALGVSARALTIADPHDRRVQSHFLEEHGIRSLHLVPVSLDDAVAALLLFGYSDPIESLSDAEADFMTKLAAGISLKLENARLFDVEHRLANDLRKRLSPSLPMLPGFDLGAALHTATRIEEVGGDFYEVFTAPDGRVVFLIGDVAGQGLAAASFTDVIRSSAKAVATIDRDPGFILDTIDQIIHSSAMQPKAASALLVVLTPETGAMEIAGAGHPPALVCKDTCHPLQYPPAPPLGFGTAPYETYAHTLEKDETLILYTDGLTDARRKHELYGEVRLLEAAQALAGDSAAGVAEGILANVLEFVGGELEDDAAVLVIRRST